MTSGLVIATPIKLSLHPRYPPPQPSSHQRHASNSAHEGWLKRPPMSSIADEQQSRLKAKLQAKRITQCHGRIRATKTTSAQLFNLSRALSRNPSGADLKLRCTEFDSNGSVTLVRWRLQEVGADSQVRLIATRSTQNRLFSPASHPYSALRHPHQSPPPSRFSFSAIESWSSMPTALPIPIRSPLFMYDLEGKLRPKSRPSQ